MTLTTNYFSIKNYSDTHYEWQGNGEHRSWMGESALSSFACCLRDVINSLSLHPGQVKTVGTPSVFVSYVDVIQLEDIGWEINPVNGLWYWDTMGVFDYLGICSEDGHRTPQAARDEACDTISICTEWGTDDGLRIVTRTVRLVVCPAQDDPRDISATLKGRAREAVIPHSRKQMFIDDCYGWDSQNFELGNSCFVRMESEHLEDWLNCYEIA